MSYDKPRILIVDDDEGIVRACAEALLRHGYEVVTALSGKEAMALLSTQQFAAAVLDIVLPDVDGLQLLQYAKQKDPDIIVLLMTGYASLETAIQALRQGAYDYLRKPFTGGELAAVLARGLQERQQRLAHRQLVEELQALNQQLMEQASLAAGELKILEQLGHKLHEASSPAEMLTQIIQAAREMTQARVGGLLWRQHTEDISCVLALPEQAKKLPQINWAQEPLLQHAWRTGEAVLESHLLHNPAAATGPLALAGFNSALIVPLLVRMGQAKRLGALFLLDSVVGFSAQHMALLQVLAAQAALLIPAVAASEPADDKFHDLREFLR